MRYKFLLFVWASLFCVIRASHAQLILGPDTLCVENKLQLTTTVTNASTYYWGFCSAYLNNIPTGSSIAAGTGLDQPSSIAMAQDTNDDYFVFVVNAGGSQDLIRYEFGKSLANVPLASNMGNFSNAIPVNPKGFELVRVGNNWYGFLVGGNTPVNSDLIRFDFGNSLSNTPTVTDLGNIGGLLLSPQDLYMFTENGNWYALTNNGLTGNLIRLEFGANITNPTPTLIDLGNPGSLAFPTGFWPMLDGGNWYLFVVNRITDRLTRLDFGSSLLNVPVDNDLGNPGGYMNGARDISIIRDCGRFYAYITNETGNNLIALNFNGSLTSGFNSIDLGNFAGFDGPRFLTRFLRYRDNVFAFTANNDDNSISRLEFNSCSASNPPTSNLQTPPPVTYSLPGLYNVYFVADEGLPTMQVDCKLIRVLPKPKIEINNDTLICQGDTIMLVVNGPGLYSNLWDPVYNVYNDAAPYDTTTIFVYPHEDYRYHVHLEFTQGGGCAYDTSVLVRVSRIYADAGEDRFVADGAYTILGGPKMSMGAEYSYVWTPSTYLNNILIPNPVCTPEEVEFYIVTVKNDSSGCVRTDTVYVRTECTDFHLPNAFNPLSDIPGNRRFGLLNNNIAKLEYFRIFNRWGQVVFETTDPSKAWDGTQKNIDLPPDNYVWIVDGYCDNGKRIRKQGTVLLTR